MLVSVLFPSLCSENCWCNYSCYYMYNWNTICIVGVVFYNCITNFRVHLLPIFLVFIFTSINKYKFNIWFYNFYFNWKTLSTIPMILQLIKTFFLDRQLLVLSYTKSSRFYIKIMQKVYFCINTSKG